MTATEYQYTLQDTDIDELQQWAPKVEDKLKQIAGVEDVASDLQLSSPQLRIDIDRDLASRVGIDPNAVETALYDAFGQRYLTELYGQLNTYHILMELKPEYQKDVSALSRI